tara:strand:- start:712 stop:2646 length:1935 start_codon:yes stop_codon:yes gene_type:complete
MNFFKKIPTLALLISGLLALVIFFSLSRSLESYELPFYDMRFRLRSKLKPLKASKDIVLVEISDDTLKGLNEWPLPRDYHGSLVDVLSELGAKAIVFDIIFSEPTLYDEPFIQSIYEAKNVYFPLVFYLDDLEAKDSLLLKSKEKIADIHSSFKDNLKGAGHINTFVDSDGKIRRVPLFIDYQDKFIPSLAFKVSADILSIDLDKITVKKNKLIIDENFSIPTSKKTSFMVNYPDTWEKSFKHVSYLQVLKSYSDSARGKSTSIDLNIFKDKICFIGLTAAGTSDLRANPLESVYPLVGLQASVCSSILEKKFIYDVGWLINALISILVFIITLLFSCKFRPFKALGANIIFSLLYFLISLGLFILAGIWIDIFLPMSIIFVSWVGVTLYKFFEQARKKQLMEKELDIAQQIQQSFLPTDISEFKGIDIFSFMKPAKFVAGDLYDVIYLDENRLGVFIGDVSGKGVPASLIMAQTISFFRIFSKDNPDPADVLNKMNQELAKVLNGRFVTAIYIIVDIGKHKLLAASAGHSPIVFYDADNNLVDDFLPESGLPLGIMDMTTYDGFEKDLKVGDKFLLYTDGITECRDKHGEEFGEQRVKDALLKDKSNSSKDIVEQLKNNVFQFSKGLPQFDDITLIVLGAVKE